MPTANSTISEAKTSLQEINSKLKNTSSDILPRIRQIKSQANMRSLMNWFTAKEDDFGGLSGSNDLGDWDDGTPGDADIYENQISEAKANADQISGTIVESIHRSIESEISMTSNIQASIDKQSAIIKTGFDNTNSTLNKILEVLTKNTAAIIETNISNGKASDEMVMNNRFNLSSYKDIVKSNFKNSSIGGYASMAAAMLPMLFSQGMPSAKDVIGMAVGAGINKAAPNLKKNLGALDSAISDVLMQSLIRLGNHGNEFGLKGTMARLFGINASRSEADTNRSSLSLKSTPFDTVTKEAITNAIPGYLRKILVAVGGPDEIYDYRSRSFKTKQAIAKDFRNASTRNTVGSLYRSSSKIKNALGTDQWTSMTFDLLMNHLGSESGPGGLIGNIIDQLNDPKFIEDLVINKLIGPNTSKYDKANAKTFAKRLSSVNNSLEYESLSSQAAVSNANRNKTMQDYINNANAFGIDLSFIKDTIQDDINAIKSSYGRDDISKNDSSIGGASSEQWLTGSNYTNRALYEIFKRLDTGINVYQMGSGRHMTGPYDEFGDKHLKKPKGYRGTSTKARVDRSGQGLIADIASSSDEDNLLRNNVDQDGNEENLTKGQRVKRWGKKRGHQLADALIHGDPTAVKDAFVDSVRDITGVAGDSMKKGISVINDKFGNISGYLGHKMFGSEYTYTDVDPETGKKIAKTVGKNEKGGVFGFVTDKVKGMFDVGKEKANKWFSEVAGYFDYGEKDKDSKDDTVGKRKKLMHASVGAMAGMGLLGGPLGIIMGAVAGNAIGQVPNIGEKLKDKLFGKDKETGAPTGLLSKAADAIITPIQYQFGKTLSFVGDKLKKNLLGPLSDIGYVLKERVTRGVSGVFSKFFGKILNVGAKALGGIAKLGGKFFEGFIGSKGLGVRGAVGIASGIAGFGFNRIADVLSLGTPGLYGELKDIRKSRNEQIKKDSAKYGSLADFRKTKWAKNKESDNIAALAAYTAEQVISTKEIKDADKEIAESNADIAKNTNDTVELLTDIKDAIAGDKASGIISESTDSSVSGSSESNNIIQFPSNKNDSSDEITKQKEENRKSGENYIVAATAGAAFGGFGNAEVKDIHEIQKAAENGESRNSIFGKFKNLLKRNKETGDKNNEEKSESFLDKLMSGLGSVVGKIWPYVLGGLTLFTEKGRELLSWGIGQLGNWLTEHLPSILKGVGGAADAFNDYAEAGIQDGKVVYDPVTNERGVLISAEEHNEKVKEGLKENAWSEATSAPRLVKSGLVAIGQHAGTNFVGDVARAGVKTTLSASNISRGMSNAFNAIKFGSSSASDAFVNSSGTNIFGKTANGVKSFFSGTKSYTKELKEASILEGDTTTNLFGKTVGSTNPTPLSSTPVGSLASKVTENMKWFKSGAGRYTSLAAGVAINTSLAAGGYYQENKMHGNYLGSYMRGTEAGGYIVTDQTKVAVGQGLAGAGLLGAAKVAAAAIAGSGGMMLPFVICSIVATVLAWFIGRLITWGVAAYDDAKDENYSVTTNATKLEHVINGDIDYSSSSPSYVFCGKDSDRVIGFNKGMFYRNPEITFGRLINSITDMYNNFDSVPNNEKTIGAEVLFYDWINNMAYQGVPWACYIADASSKNADVSKHHANEDIWNESTSTGNNGGWWLFNSDTVQVTGKKCKDNIDTIMKDVQDSMKANGYDDCMWNLEDLTAAYDAGKEVYKELQQCGILDNKGKVNTKKFKGAYNSGKNDEGWKSLRKLGTSKDVFFVVKCLVYINAHIDVKDDQQWINLRGDDVSNLVRDLCPDGDSEIADSLTNNEGTDNGFIKSIAERVNDVKDGNIAEITGTVPGSFTASELRDYVTNSKTMSLSDITDIHKQIQYITAGWAFSHPKTMTEWLKKKGAEYQRQFGIVPDDINKHKFERWYEYDERVRESYLSSLRQASVSFAEENGDILGLSRYINWNEFINEAGSQGVGIMGTGDSMIQKYGASIALKNDVSKGPSVGNYITDMYKEYYEDLTKVPTPDEVHSMLFGSSVHDGGLEKSDTDAFDSTITGSSLLGRIAKNIWMYPSDEFKSIAGESSLNTNDYDDYNYPDYIKAMSLGKPKNLPEDLPIGGPVDAEVSMKAMTDGGSSKNVEDGEAGESAESDVQDGGNPLINKDFKITSAFGATAGRPHSGAHKGVDLVPADGSGQSEVGSRFSGTVVDVKDDIPDSVRARKSGAGKWEFPYSSKLGTGNMVSIRTDDGFIVKNMHLKAGSIPGNIRPGAKIGVGQRIGTMGSTGWSTGNHLHYEFRGPNDELIDPTSSLSGKTSWSSDAGTPTTSDTSNSVYMKNSDISTYSTEPEVEDNRGPLAILLDKLRETGNKFLNKITGGLVGSDSSSSNEDVKLKDSGSTISMNSISNGSYITGNCNSEWITVVKDIKKLVAEQHPSYNQEAYIPITYRGKTLKVRTDCTGIICAMLKFYGVMADNDNLNSDMMLKASAIKSGFDQVDFPGWDNLVEGDILVRSGHAEIFAKNEGSTHYVYNGGDTAPLCTPGATVSSHSSYVKIWRCREAVSENPTFANVSTVTGSNSDAVFKKLKSLGYSDAAASGIMGVWEVESSNDSKTVEGDYLKSYPGYDTVMSSIDAMNEYTRGILFPAYRKSNKKINESQYLGGDGNLYPGIGLAQWTGDRHYKLKQHADKIHKDWRDMDAQIEYMDKEKGSRKIDDNFKTLQDPAEAAETFARNFEGTTIRSMLDERMAHARNMYEHYKGSAGNDSSIAEDDPMAYTDGEGTGGPMTMENLGINSNSSIIKNSNYKNPNMYSQPTGNTPSTSSRILTTSVSRAPLADDSSTKNTIVSNDEILMLLKEVIGELRSINGNTGTSNSLLQSLGENGIVDKDLRNQLGSIKSKGSGKSVNPYTGRGPNTASNTRMITSMIRP